MAVVTITLTDLPPAADGKTYVRVQLKSNPPLPPGKDFTDLKQVSMAQFMGRFGVTVIAEALEEYFKGTTTDITAASKGPKS